MATRQASRISTATKTPTANSVPDDAYVIGPPGNQQIVSNSTGDAWPFSINGRATVSPGASATRVPNSGTTTAPASSSSSSGSGITSINGPATVGDGRPTRTNQGPSIPTYTPPARDENAQNTLTSLLAAFGIDYQNGPRATPQLLTFLRGLGMSKDTAEDNFNSAIQMFDNRAADSRGDLIRRGVRQRNDVRVGAERRNALVSGATNTQLGRQAEDEAARRADIERALAEGTNQAQSTLNTVQDNYRQQALERTINEETSQEVQEARAREQAEAYQRQREESDRQFERVQEAEQRRNDQRIALIQGL